jgi:hypothetical protein
MVFLGFIGLWLGPKSSARGRGEDGGADPRLG